MGKVSFNNQKQVLIFNEAASDEFLKTHFYFTGGTALSAFYLQHRVSEDLDFFSEHQFDTQLIIDKISNWGGKYGFEFKSKETGSVRVYNLTFSDKETLKVDFVTYPHKLIEKGIIYNGFSIDSLTDIAVNKLLTINQRTEVKDFVDLYFLLKKLTVWDLMEGLRIKFRMKTEPFIVGSDFMKVDEFQNMPKMIIPLDLSDLRIFFRQKAKELGSQAVE